MDKDFLKFECAQLTSCPQWNASYTIVLSKASLFIVMKKSTASFEKAKLFRKGNRAPKASISVIILVFSDINTSLQAVETNKTAVNIRNAVITMPRMWLVSLELNSLGLKQYAKVLENCTGRELHGSQVGHLCSTCTCFSNDCEEEDQTVWPCCSQQSSWSTDDFCIFAFRAHSDMPNICKSQQIRHPRATVIQQNKQKMAYKGDIQRAHPSTPAARLDSLSHRFHGFARISD